MAHALVRNTDQGQLNPSAQVVGISYAGCGALVSHLEVII